jgi:MoxR-like ATPase
VAIQSTTASGVDEFAALFESIVDNVARVIHGKRAATGLALVCLTAEGHLLLEDVPGVGKTSLAKALARSLGLGWQRIQFTPDLLPSDVTGASIFDRTSSQFTFRPGAVFANVLLGDEINRASPKTQSALLEAMEERQVTIDGVTHPLPSPFLVVATQNPAEHEGTYPLPESQIDRFLLRIRLGYPEHQAEVAMLDQEGTVSADDLGPIGSPGDVATMIKVAANIYVAPALRGYLVDLATATRSHPAIDLGMSPRATLGLQRSAKARAASLGREYVTPDDIKHIAEPVLGHRLVLATDAQLGGVTVAEVIADVLASVSVPSGRTGPEAR